jgi:uncharacterized protein
MKPIYLFPLIVLLSCEVNQKEFIIDELYLTNFQADQSSLLNARKPYLQLVGLYKLEYEENTFGADSANNFVLNISNLPSKIGSIIPSEDVLLFKAVDGVEVKNELDSLVTSLQLELDENGNSIKLHYNQLVWQVITRGGEYYLRLWDLENPLVAAFEGFELYELNPEFIFEGNFTYYAQPKAALITTQLGSNEPINFIGNVSFTYGNKDYNLDIQDGGFIIVGDKTTGNETYGGGRYMYLDLSKADSLVRLDFNYLYNPPCTFSEFTTCPLPPSQNIVPFAILAGEKYDDKLE